MKVEPTITVEVDTQGHIIVEVNNVQGPVCKALTKELEDTLGTTTSQKLKPECGVVDLSSGQKQQQTLGGNRNG